MKKLLCLLLIACLMIPALIACADTSTEPKETTPAATESETEEETTDDSYIDKKTALGALADHYTIVFHSDYVGSFETARKMINLLEAHTDRGLRVYMDETTDVSKREFLFGFTNREESAVLAEDLDYYDYQISVKNKKLLVAAGSTTAYNWALTELSSMLENDQLDFSTDSNHIKRFEINLNPIVTDFSSFTPNWLSKYTPAEWMTNADGSNTMEKAYALTRPHDTGYRITTQTHRGDIPNYPEGSIESIASCIWAGIDVMELDLQFTKDGVAILHHDDTLNRMTNAKKYVGTEGYPDSYLVSDWTYEQISELYLKAGLGGNNAKVTTYKVPTLYEALKVCAGRIFIQIDDKHSVMSDSTYGFYPIAAATDSEIYFMTQFDPDRYYGGICDTKVLSTLKQWLSYDPTNTELADFIVTLQGWLDEPTGNMRGEPCWPNPVTEYRSLGSRSNHVETAETWEIMMNLKYYHIWTEKPLVIANYIKTNFRAETVPQ